MLKEPSRSRFVCLIQAVLLWSAVLAAPNPVVGACYVAEGTGVWESWLLDEPKEKHVVNFAVQFDDDNANQWKIEFSYPNEYVDKFISTTDGTNILTVARYKPQHTNAIAGYAFVEKSAVPRADGYLPLSAIWLAFVSGHYVDSLTNNQICPPYFKDGHSGKSGYYPTVAFDVLREPVPHGLVKSLFFYHDGRGINSLGQWITAPAPFDGGFTNAVLNIHRDSKGIPADVKLEYYYPFIGGKAKPGYQLYLTESCRLVVTNVVASKYHDEFLEQASANLNYIDRRFVSYESPEMRISYLSDHFRSDSEVMSMGEFKTAQKKQEGVKRSLATAPAPKPRSPKLIRFILGAAIVLGALGIGSAILASRKQQQKKMI